jgi:hypothetical protein
MDGGMNFAPKQSFLIILAQRNRPPFMDGGGKYG